jgi:hypothetical protein
MPKPRVFRVTPSHLASFIIDRGMSIFPYYVNLL